MKKSELKEIIKECIQESEEKDVWKSIPSKPTYKKIGSDHVFFSPIKDDESAFGARIGVGWVWSDTGRPGFGMNFIVFADGSIARATALGPTVSYDKGRKTLEKLLGRK